MSVEHFFLTCNIYTEHRIQLFRGMKNVCFEIDIYCVYPAMSKKSENLSDLNKKDRNKRHSSPFINVSKGVFFVVRATFVPVSYLSALSEKCMFWNRYRKYIIWKCLFWKRQKLWTVLNLVLYIYLYVEYFYRT
jgi:hypothetical protein